MDRVKLGLVAAVTAVGAAIATPTLIDMITADTPDSLAQGITGYIKWVGKEIARNPHLRGEHEDAIAEDYRKRSKYPYANTWPASGSPTHGQLVLEEDHAFTVPIRQCESNISYELAAEKALKASGEKDNDGALSDKDWAVGEAARSCLNGAKIVADDADISLPGFNSYMAKIDAYLARHPRPNKQLAAANL